MTIFTPIKHPIYLESLEVQRPDIVKEMKWVECLAEPFSTSPHLIK